MGFPCKDLAEEIKAAYPGVTNTTTAFDGQYENDCQCIDNSEDCLCAETMGTRQGLQTTSNSTADTHTGSDDRLCLFNFCEPIIPGLDCTIMADILETIIRLFGDHYTSWISEILEDCLPSPAIAIDGLPVVCINKLCTLQSGPDCGDLQVLLQSAVKAKLDRDIEFTIDGTICGY